MLDLLRSLLSYGFIQRALAAGTLVALCSALLGVSLVLKRYSMIGDGLSHVGFGAMAVAVALGAAPLTVALPAVMLAAFFLLQLSRNHRINGDSAIALVSSSALAIGVVATSLSSGSNIDVMNYLFGSILTMSEEDVVLAAILSAVVLTLFLLLYHRIFAITFDETFARATGIRANLYNTVLAMLTAVTIVIGMRLMGTLLISSLIIFPALSSMRVCRSFRGVVLGAAVIAVVCFWGGVITSFALATPTGASVVLANLIVFILLAVVQMLREHHR